MDKKFLIRVCFFSFFFSCDRVQHRFFMGCADLKIGILTILNIAGSVAHWIKRENLLVQKIMDWKYTRFENLVGNVRTFPKKCPDMSLAFLPFCMGTFPDIS